MLKRTGTLLLYALLIRALPLTTGYPSGAPSSACEDMIPRHSGVPPQPNPAPYSILTSSRTFQPGQPVTVVIKGPDYRGVLLEARMESTVNAVGNWKTPPANTKFLQCSGGQGSAITHSNTNVKDDSTVYSWIPPPGISRIYFKATVAQQRTVFWLNVTSATLKKGPGGGVVLAAGAEPVLSTKARLLLLVPAIVCTLLCSR